MCLSAKTQTLQAVEGGEVVGIEVHARSHIHDIGDDLCQLTLLVSVKHVVIRLKVAVQQLSIKSRCQLNHVVNQTKLSAKLNSQLNQVVNQTLRQLNCVVNEI